MDRFGRSLGPLGLLGLFGLLGPTGALARAQAAATSPPEPGPAAVLEVEAEPGCASRDDLVAGVTSRAPRIRFLPGAPGAPVLRATIARDARGTVMGELTVVEADGQRRLRRLQAPSCAEATEALALVIALTLDPAYAEAAGPRPQAPQAPSAPPPPPSPATPPTAAIAAIAAPPPPTPAAPPTAEQATRESVPEPIREPVRRIGAAAAAQVVSGPAPRAMPGIALQLLASLDRASIWSPALSLWATHAWASGLAESGGTADFALDAMALDLCPLRARLAAVEIGACGAGLVGRLSARGSNTYSPRSAARPFATLGGAATLVVPLGGVLEIRGRFGASATLIRDAFLFTPEVFYRAASVTLIGDLGLGARFP